MNKNISITISVIILCLFVTGCTISRAGSHEEMHPDNINELDYNICREGTEFKSLDEFKTYLEGISFEKGDETLSEDEQKSAEFKYGLLKEFYIPLDDLIPMNDSLWERLKSITYIPFWDNNLHRLTYCFDIFTIETVFDSSPTAANDISGNLAERNTSLPVTDYAAWKAEKSFSPGFLTRTDGNRSAIYTIDNGRVESVKVLAGSCRIHITLNSHPEGKNAAEAAEEFLTSPATAGFAALFSEDDTVFRAAVDKINAGLTGR